MLDEDSEALLFREILDEDQHSGDVDVTSGVIDEHVPQCSERSTSACSQRHDVTDGACGLERAPAGILRNKELQRGLMYRTSVF